MTATWSRPAPAGEIPLGLVVVPPGADPLVRTDWRFRPVVRTLRVTPAAAPPGPAWHVVGPLALLALLAVVVVCAIRRPFMA